MIAGFVTILRQITEWQWYKSHTHRGVFLHLILKANFKDNKKGRTLIRRGSLVTSCQILADELNYTKKTILKTLRDLEDTGEIKRKTSNLGTTITICNYDLLQKYGVLTTPPSNTPSIPPSIPPSKRQVSTNNNVNKETKKQVKVEFDINAIYVEYPKKTDKEKGMKKLHTIIKDQSLYDKVLQGAINYNKFLIDQGTARQFIKGFGSWVNGKCWEDELVTDGQAREEAIAKLDEAFKNF